MSRPVMRFHGRRLFLPRRRVYRDGTLTMEPIIRPGREVRESYFSYKAPDTLAMFKLEIREITSDLAKWVSQQRPGPFEAWSRQEPASAEGREWVHFIFPLVEWDWQWDGALALVGETHDSDKTIPEFDGLVAGHGGWVYSKSGPP